MRINLSLTMIMLSILSFIGLLVIPADFAKSHEEVILLLPIAAILFIVPVISLIDGWFYFVLENGKIKTISLEEQYGVPKPPLSMKIHRPELYQKMKKEYDEAKIKHEKLNASELKKD